MTTDLDYGQPSLLEPDIDSSDAEFGSTALSFEAAGNEREAPARPINWNLLTADEAEAEWLDLNAWANWLRTTYGLSPAVLPPFWHRHDELVWELSALHIHWLNAYDADGSPSRGIGTLLKCATGFGSGWRRPAPESTATVRPDSRRGLAKNRSSLLVRCSLRTVTPTSCSS